ncbi:antitoxin Xre/MbcA/ParS toxin-binding domain-containing protein [Celerinatantimonas sp. YJH-8]
MNTQIVASETIDQLFPEVDILSPSGYLTAVRAGLSGDKLRIITKFIGDRELVARSIGKDASNLSRSYRVKLLPPAVTDNLIDTVRVYLQAAQIYDSMELAKEWMNSPIPSLGGEIPATLLDTHAGRELVRQTLRKMEYGEYV